MSAILLNALTSAGFALAGLITALRSGGMAANYAMYAATRSFSLLAAALWLISRGQRRLLGAMAVLLALVQACDTFVGVAQSDAGKTFGPAVLAVITLLASRRLLETPHRLTA